MHEPGDESVVGSVAVIVHTLHERRRTVANTDDRHANGCHGALLGPLRRVAPGVCPGSGVCKCAQCNTKARAASWMRGAARTRDADPVTGWVTRVLRTILTGRP